MQSMRESEEPIDKNENLVQVPVRPVAEEQSSTINREHNTPVVREQVSPLNREHNTPVVKEQVSPVNREHNTPVVKEQNSSVKRNEDTSSLETLLQPIAVRVGKKYWKDDKYILMVDCNRKEANMYYAINDAKYKLYQGSIVVDCNCIVSVYADLQGQVSEVIKEIVDSFKVSNPIIEVVDRTIAIKTGTINSVVYYTIDGKEPSTNSNLYEGEFFVNKSVIIKAIAVKQNWKNSEIVSQQVTVIPTKEERVRKITLEENVIGISYKGDSHIKTNSSCQDYHHFEKINNVWSIAIVSDGAGSAKHSDEGSRAVCAAFTFYIKKMIETNPVLNKGDLLDGKTWDIEFKGMLARFQSELKKKLVKPDMPFESFAATIILFVFSSKGYMVAHVGDGRAGIKSNGEWQSVISPHKGEEANQTIFSTSKYFGENYIPNLKMSNVYVPETDVSSQPIEAFVLMSDGCENGAWMTYQKKDLPGGDFRVEDVNMPRSSCLEQCVQLINLSKDAQKAALIDFITESSNAFTNEPDDKTILIGRLL